MNTNIAKAVPGEKLRSGRLKLQYDTRAVAVILFIVFLFVLSIVIFSYGISTGGIKFMIIPIICLPAVIYLCLIIPYTQKSSNYHIEFRDEHTLKGFKLSYKGKQVKIDYEIDGDGKIFFTNNRNKLSCISYADGSPMSNLTKYRIINYFIRWLSNNKILSPKVTASFE